MVFVNTVTTPVRCIKHLTWIMQEQFLVNLHFEKRNRQQLFLVGNRSRHYLLRGFVETGHLVVLCICFVLNLHLPSWQSTKTYFFVSYKNVVVSTVQKSGQYYDCVENIVLWLVLLNLIQSRVSGGKCLLHVKPFSTSSVNFLCVVCYF